MNTIQKIPDEVKIGNQNLFRNKKDEILWSKKILHKHSENWENRAQAKSKEIPHSIFMLEKQDFLTELLPFHEHPIFMKASEAEKQTILSCGFIAYNNKTLEVEGFIIIPACLNVNNEIFPGVADNCCKRVISETLTDESYHILLTVRASQITRQYRKLDRLEVPKSNLILNIEKLQSKYPEPWQKNTILLVTAIVCEIFIGGYLRSLAKAKDIQPLSTITTNAHLMDELSHHSIFKELAKLIYSAMNITEKEFFAHVLPYPIYWFVDNDLNVWDTLLQQINFEPGNSMLNDCRSELKSPMEQADFTELIKLAKELDIDDINNRILECNVD